ncbi:MAG: hypothetical protein JKY48_14355 [Flavobacteriales bacterium]|nr:hypothetical protein [Flavobacteriales bacterium]
MKQEAIQLYFKIATFVAMKLFAAVLGIFFLCLAAMPCADAANTAEVSVELSQEHEHEGEADNCAPFCYCHCCHVHVTINDVSEETDDQPIYGKRTVHYFVAIPDLVSNSLFRPPIV